MAFTPKPFEDNKAFTPKPFESDGAGFAPVPFEESTAPAQAKIGSLSGLPSGAGTGFTGAAKPDGKAISKDVFIDAPKEIPKGIARGTERLFASVGSGVELGGDVIESRTRQLRNAIYETPFGQKVLEKRRQKFLEGGGDPKGELKEGAPSAGDTVSTFGEDIHDFWNEAAATGREARDPEIFSGTFIENPSVARLVGGAAESTPTMLAALALSVGGAPNVGAALLAGSEALPIYTEAKRLGSSEKDAFSYALLSGIGSAALERVGLDALTGKNPLVDALVAKLGKNWVAGAMVNLATEGTQESLQEIYQNAVALGYDEDREVLNGALEAGLIGWFLGGTVGGSRNIVSDFMEKQGKAAQEATDNPIEPIPVAEEQAVTTPEGAPVTVTTDPVVTTPEGVPITIDTGAPVLDDRGGQILPEQAEAQTKPIKPDEAPLDKAIEPVQTLSSPEQQVAKPQPDKAGSSSPADTAPTREESVRGVDSSSFTRDDGETLQGEITAESDTNFTVRDAEGVNHTLPKKFWSQEEAAKEDALVNDMTAAEAKAAAESIGVKFVGMQDMGDGTAQPMFNAEVDGKDGGSFMAEEGQTLQQAFDANEKRQAVGQKEPTISPKEDTVLPKAPDFSDTKGRDVLDGRINTRETRGSGERFHGTSSKIGQLDDNSYSPLNIFGQGFYSTDASDVAVGYTKKGRGGDPTIYKVTENGNLKMFDLEVDVTGKLASDINEIIKDTPFSELGGKDVDGKEIKNLRQLYNEIRDDSADEGWSADDVQGIFDSIRVTLENAGYNGVSHVGAFGAKGFKPHDVRIYFSPSKDISINETNPADLAETKEEPISTPPAEPETDQQKDEAAPKQDGEPVVKEELPTEPVKKPVTSEQVTVYPTISAAQKATGATRNRIEGERGNYTVKDVTKQEDKKSTPKPKTLAKPAIVKKPATVKKPSADQKIIKKPVPQKKFKKLTKEQDKLLSELQDMTAAQVNEQAKQRGINTFDGAKRKQRDAIEEEIIQHKEVAPVPVAEEPVQKKSTGKLSPDELRTRAAELGINFNKTTPISELRKKVRETTSGGFIDTAVNGRDKKGEHPFIKQQRDNDKRVHQWYKDGTKRAISKLAETTVDRQADIKKSLKDVGGDEAARRMTLAAGSSAEATRQFKDAERAINKVLPRRNRTLMKDYISAVSTIEATESQAQKGVELKSPVEVDAAKDWVNNTFDKMPDAERDAVVEAAEIYWGVMNESLTTLKNEGLISKESFDAVSKAHKFYSPRLFIDFIDPVSKSPTGESAHDSGIKALGEGSDSALAQDPFFLMEHVLTRTQKRVFTNRANKSLFDLSQTEEGKKLVRPLKRSRDINEKTGVETFNFESPARDEGVVKVFIDGIENQIAMPERVAEEWNGLPPVMAAEWAKVLQWGTGTKILKALATGANPEFALSNLPRDAFYSWFVSGQYNSVLPIGLAQLGADYARVAKDAVTKKGAYIDFIKEGGGMDFLTTQGAIGKSPLEGGNRVVGKIGEILAWAGEASEVATRLAVRDRAIKNGMSPEEATFAARDMLDFAQGGTYVKAADNAVPYLSAAVQGTRGGFRTFKNKPIEASFKAAQLASIGFGMAWSIAHFFPELWDSIDDREKATKWIIPLPSKTKDKNGNERQAYVAIAKDQFQQFFSAVGQSAADGRSGRPWSGQLIDSMKSILPVDATTLPPIAAASQAYFGNYDTWTKDDVWQGYEDISASNEFTYKTPELSKDISGLAKKAGIEVSPDRLTAATSKIIPRSNPLAGVFASMYQAMQGDTDNIIGNTAVEQVKASPFLRRLLRFSRPINVQSFTQEKAERLDIDTEGMTDMQARRAVTEASTEQSDVRQPKNVDLDKFLALEKRNSGQVRKWLRDNVDDKDERQRLWNRAKNKHPDDIKGSYTPSRRPSRPSRSRGR